MEQEASVASPAHYPQHLVHGQIIHAPVTHGEQLFERITDITGNTSAGTNIYRGKRIRYSVGYLEGASAIHLHA